MKCPHCHSGKIHRFGVIKNKQRYHCQDCGRYFQSSYEQLGYSSDVKRICLKMYLNGMGLRGIERVTGIHHTTIMNWVRESGEELPEDEEGDLPIIAELDELQTYVGKKACKIWVWTAINHYLPGILAIEIGDRSGKTFEKLWTRIKAWDSRRYLTDGYCVYSHFIDPKKHLVLPKTQMTRVEGENTRVRHYLARLHRATLCYSKSKEMLKYSIRLLMYYLRFKKVPIPA
jgi:IS1 family transposase/transposase-like protein